MRKGIRVMLKKDSRYYTQSKGGVGILDRSFLSGGIWWYIQWNHLKADYPEKDILIVDFNEYIKLCGNREYIG